MHRPPPVRAGGGRQLSCGVVAAPEGATFQPVRRNDGTLAESFSGHSHRDPVIGEVYAIAYDGAVWDTIRHVVLTPAGCVVRDQPIPVAHGPCIDDCGVTTRHVVELNLPVTFSMRALFGGHAFPFRWKPKHPALVGLLPRGGDTPIWCEVEPCFVSHAGNVFDEGNRVVADVIAYPRRGCRSRRGACGSAVSTDQDLRRLHLD